MKPKNILLFGASGQIGRHLIRKLTKNNFKVTAVTRNIHRKGYILKTQGNPGYLDIVEANIFDIEKLNLLIKYSDICINLIGILYEYKKNNFKNIHVNFPSIIADMCSEHNLKHFIHISALGIEKAIDSKYAASKLEGEKIIKNKFPKATILRPSVVYSVDDNFTTNLMTLLNILPIFPLYYKGDTKFMPIHCSDLTEIIYDVINNEIYSEIIECVGPEKMTFKEILKQLLHSINKKRLLIPMPLLLANFSAKFFELMPKPLLTTDQLRLLKYDNISSGNYKTNFDLNMKSNLNFKDEIEKYSYMWKDAGQFSRGNE